MKESSKTIIGLSTLVASGYSAKKLRDMSSDFSALQRQNAELQRQNVVQTGMTLQAIEGVMELQVATMHGLREIDSKLQTLSKISWDIASHFKEVDRREGFLGDLKMIVISFEEALDDIDELSEDYLEYATLQVETLQSLVGKHDVRLEHFKRMERPEDIKWVRSVLRRIDDTHNDFLNRMENPDGN
jgi:hypothetical protein